MTNRPGDAFNQIIKASDALITYWDCIIGERVGHQDTEKCSGFLLLL